MLEAFPRYNHLPCEIRLQILSHHLLGNAEEKCYITLLWSRTQFQPLLLTSKSMRREACSLLPTSIAVNSIYATLYYLKMMQSAELLGKVKIVKLEIVGTSDIKGAAEAVEIAGLVRPYKNIKLHVLLEEVFEGYLPNIEDSKFNRREWEEQRAQQARERSLEDVSASLKGRISKCGHTSGKDYKLENVPIDVLPFAREMAILLSQVHEVTWDDWLLEQYLPQLPKINRPKICPS
jgi:hypothetical protein